jgi:hypothetical protein
MTPYEFALDIADRIKPLGVPTPVMAQLGGIIIDCQGSWVTITNVSEQELVEGTASCGVVEMADIEIVAAFECSITSDDEGLTDPAKLAAVAAEQDVVGVALVDFVRDEIKKSFVDAQFGGIQFANNTGGLATVIVSATLPIP